MSDHIKQNQMFQDKFELEDKLSRCFALPFTLRQKIDLQLSEQCMKPRRKLVAHPTGKNKRSGNSCVTCSTYFSLSE